MTETMSFVATMYRTPEGTFEPKQYTFVIQVPAKPEKPSTDKLLVLGDTTMDLARFAPNVDEAGQRFHLPVPTKLKRIAQVHGTVTVTIVQARMAIDGLTNISAGTGALSSAPLGIEQVRARNHVADGCARMERMQRACAPCRISRGSVTTSTTRQRRREGARALAAC
jgi:hypothetical protein